MSFHPFDLAALLRVDLVVLDVLLARIENGRGSRELLVADLVAGASLHVAASDAVLAPALEQHLIPGEELSAALLDENRRVAEALAVLDEPNDPAAAAAIGSIHAIVSRHLAEFEPAVGGESELLARLRVAVGAEGMVALGHEYMSAKRHAPSRPHPNSNSALIRIVGVIDRVKDAASGRAILASTDGSGILNTESQDVINALAELGPKPIEILEPEQARRQPAPIDAVNQVLEQRDQDIVPPFVARVDDTTIHTDAGELTVRIYDAAPDAERLKPVVLYIHGGGWVIADIYSYDASARGLALLLDAVVVSVDYRRAPEHRFPSAHDDVCAALQWLREHADELGGDGRRIALVGESAGGNMAAAATLDLIRSGRSLPLAQVLIYPVTSMSQDWPSFREHADARPLNTAMLNWFAGHLLADPADADDRLDLMSAPTTDLARMPPTLVITAERDPLHDQGVAFAERLKELGVAAALREYHGVPHEFFGMSRVLAEARDAQSATAALLVSVFAETN